MGKKQVFILSRHIAPFSLQLYENRSSPRVLSCILSENLCIFLRHSSLTWEWFRVFWEKMLWNRIFVTVIYICGNNTVAVRISKKIQQNFQACLLFSSFCIFFISNFRNISEKSADTIANPCESFFSKQCFD